MRRSELKEGIKFHIFVPDITQRYEDAWSVQDFILLFLCLLLLSVGGWWWRGAESFCGAD